ncbi:MAG: peroxide stress protein YaaA [Glaciihabitans sp.]|nr:peroxide stress protein YaaA [Glaciihabitans sp.]
MLILLPPSETKRDGGVPGSSLDVRGLSFSSLEQSRRHALAELQVLSGDPEAAARALKIGPSLHFELARNSTVGSSPLLPAMDRYTGVLYDALDTASLDSSARAFLADNVVIASALFGLVGAGDGIPAYRMSHNSRLQDLRPKAHWRSVISAALAEHSGLILDLRSEAYVELGPIPSGANSAYLRLVADGPDGVRRALNHFNKKGKGEFVRALAQSGISHDSTDSLIAWATSQGIRLSAGVDGELDLVV